MKAYSLDLRQRIVAAVRSGQLIKEVAERYGVSRWTIQDYMKRDAQGKLAPEKHPGHPPHLQGDDLEALRQQVEDHPDWTLEKRATELVLETGVELKKSAIGKYLKQLGMTHKKRASLQASETNESVRPTVSTSSS